MTKAYGRLPSAHLSVEVHIGVDRDTWKEIATKLRAQAPNEGCTFVLTRPSRGVRRTSVLLREILWPKPGDVVATPQMLEISADYISRAMDAAIDAGPMVGLCLIHTHPSSELG